MKNLVKLFGLSIVLSIAGLNAVESSSEKIYVDSEDITFEDGTIYLHLENDTLKKPIIAVYSDEKGIYVLNQDDELDQIAEPGVLCVKDAQDTLGQLTEQEILYTQDTQQALDQSTEQEAICAKDDLDQSNEQEIFYTQDNQDALDQAIKEETLYAQNAAYRELLAGYECHNCGRINPRYRKTCKDCEATIIH